MQNYTTAKVISNAAIAANIYDMKLKLDCDLSNFVPGQFVEIYIPRGEHLLPRPISICEMNESAGICRIVYQIAGKGTDFMSTVQAGETLQVLIPLGNGFDITKEKNRYAVIGGGVGVPPMLELCKRLIAMHPTSTVDVFLGFRSEVILHEDFKKLGVNIHIATDDGSAGFCGNVISLLSDMDYSCDMIFSCGPKVMLKSLSEWAAQKEIPTFVSMEERMACGLGVCVGCSLLVQNKAGDTFYKKVCKDGPIFDSSEVVWNAE